MTKPHISRLVLASGNKGKLREINQLLHGLHIEAIPQTEFNVPDVEETGLTFVENAIIKARNASMASGLPAVADDSGLIVDALQGEPGIYSARYAGRGALDQDNLQKLLDALVDVPKAARTARFVCWATCN